VIKIEIVICDKNKNIYMNDDRTVKFIIEINKKRNLFVIHTQISHVFLSYLNQYC